MPAPEPPADLSGLSLVEIARLAGEKKLPPVDKWNPQHCGDSGMRIARDGTWFHEGSPIGRVAIPMGDLRGYGEREQTRTDHLREVVSYAGWRTVGTGEWKELDEFLFARAMEHDSPKLLFRLACE